MLKHQTDADSGVVEIEVDGAIHRDEYNAVVAALESAIAAHGKLRVLEIVRSVGPIDPSVWWKDVTWGFAHLSKLGRCAVVTDKGWVGSITRAVSALMPAEIRVFHLDEIDAARAWIREG